MSSGPLNRYGPYESSCDLNDKTQHWKWCSDNKLCNHLGQFLSKKYIGTSTDPNGKTKKLFSMKLLGFSNNFDQNWRVTASGQLVDGEYGLCLGVEYNSVDRQHLLIGIKSCDEKDSAQFWSFSNIWTEISTARPNSKSRISSYNFYFPINLCFYTPS